MQEFRGPGFQRVLAYAEDRCADIPPVSRERAIFNHVRAWVVACTVPRGTPEIHHKVDVEWIKEGERVVGVKAYV